MIEYRCECGAAYQVQDHMAGWRAECEKCGKAGKIPGGPSSAGSPGRTGGPLSSVGDLIARAWELYKSKAVTIVLVYLAGILGSVVVSVLFVLLGIMAVKLYPALKVPIMIGGTAGTVLAAVYLFGWVYASLYLAASSPEPGFSKSFSDSRPLALPFAWMAALIGFLVMGGYLFLILPGIFLTVSLFFAPFVRINENVSGLEALARSWSYVKGRWWAVALRLFVVWLIYLTLSALPVAGAILAIVALPFPILHSYAVYQELKHSRPGPARGGNGPVLATGLAGYILLAGLGIMFGRQIVQRAKQAGPKLAMAMMSASKGGMKMQGLSPAQTQLPAAIETSTTESPPAQAAPNEAPIVRANHRAELSDPAEGKPMPNYNHDNKPEMDMTRAVFESDGRDLHVTVEFKEEVNKYLDAYQAGNSVATLYMDTDNDPVTGKKSFYGDRPGYELSIAFTIGIEYENGGQVFGGSDKGSKIKRFLPSFWARSLENNAAKGVNLRFLDEKSLGACSIEGRSVKMKVAYADLGLTPGQAVRISTEKEAHTQGGEKYLQDLVLVLK